MKTRTTAFYLLYATMFLTLATSSFGQLTKVWENHYASSIDSMLISVTGDFYYGNKLQFDGSDNCYFLSQVIVPHTGEPVANSHPQMQIIKYNSSGSTLWIHKDSFANPGDCSYCGIYPFPYQMIVNNDGSVYDLADYNNWTPYYQQYLASIKSNGVNNWNIIGFGDQNNADMTEDNKGNLGIVANSSANWPQNVLTKVTSAGNLLWSYSYSSPDGFHQATPKITSDKAGNFYVLHAAFEQFPDSANVWLSKFDTSGALLWDKKLDSGETVESVPDMLYNTIDSGLYITYTITPNDYTGIRFEKLMKVTTTGIINWQKNTNNIDGYVRIKQDKQGNVYWWVGTYAYGLVFSQGQLFEGTIFKYKSDGSASGVMSGSSFDVDASGYTYANHAVSVTNMGWYDAIKKYSPTGTLLYDKILKPAPRYYINEEVYCDQENNLYTLSDFSDADTISVTKYNAACSATTAPAKLKSITGSTVIYCNNSSYSYNCPAVSKATYYNWTVPTGVIIDSGQGTTKLYVHDGTGFKTGQVSVYAANCFGASAAIAKAITDTLKPVGKITGPTSVCKGQTYVAYSIPAVAGALYYHWTIPADATFSSGYEGNGDNGTSVEINFGSTSGKVSAFAVNYCDSDIAKSLQVKVTACASGMITMSEENKAIIYPNPSSGAFTLRLGNAGKNFTQPALIMVKDASGKIVEQLQNVTSGFVSFGSRLTPGVYFVEVITGNEKQVLKVVKE